MQPRSKVSIPAFSSGLKYSRATASVSGPGELPFFDQWNEKRAGLREDLEMGIQFMDSFRIGSRINGSFRADDPNLSITRDVHGRISARLDDPQNRNVEFLPEVFQSPGRGGIAGHHDRLDLFPFQEEPDDLRA